MIKKFITLSKEHGVLATIELFVRKLLNKEKNYYSEIYGSNTNDLSIDFQESEGEVQKGEVPTKYKHLIPEIPGRKVLEIGAGEGLFALSLAQSKEKVTAVDIAPYRTKKAGEIQEEWSNKGARVENCEFITGDIFENKHLFNDVDTLVARRVIYYFRGDLWPLMDLIKSNIRYVCLAGNPDRSRDYKEGKETPLDEYAYYSTIEGMKELLEQYGFKVTLVDDYYDPTVIGENQNWN